MEQICSEEKNKFGLEQNEVKNSTHGLNKIQNAVKKYGLEKQRNKLDLEWKKQ